ncbi:AAA family ATPase [Kocuria sp. CPCC 205268]|uniref:AAA family ATPase n=1 Tax=Kocuria oxytropis TaxID=3058913 RepID=UPI0034D68FCB
MLTFTRLIVQDFGPYRGRQEMPFSNERGVYIVYGRNGRGKTTLHNAFRYALYGQIMGRRGLEPAKLLANSEARKQSGYASFQTVLEFKHNESYYRLTRRFDGREQQHELMMLERDGNAMSQLDAEKTLQAIAPRSVSGFYLFDGEQLRQYEELLDPDSEQGHQLEQAIENVLGIPIVNNAKSDIEFIGQKTDKELANVASANNRTKLYGEALNEAQDIRLRMQEGRDEIARQMEATKHRVAELEDRLREQQKAERKLGQLEGLRAREAALQRDLMQAHDALNALSPDLWMSVLAPSASERLTRVEAELLETEAALRSSAAAFRDLAHLKEADDCPVCHRDMDWSLREHLTAELEGKAAATNPEDLQDRQTRARAKRQVLEALSRKDASLLVERDGAIRTLRLNLDEVCQDMDEIERELAEVGEDELRSLITERDDLRAQILRDKERLEEQDEKIREQEQQIEDLKRKLRSLSVNLDHRIELKDKLADELTLLFGEAIDAYRAKLRQRVEDRASEIFRQMVDVPDYVGLRINERYGLEMLDLDGEVVRRSAGYEHIVALSLIAALQRSAAVRAPVIMDYPFGRLDPENTSRVVAALPRMADQVVLLSFEGEFDRNAALQALKTELAAEYTLEYVSSKHTRIEPRRMIS